MSNVSNSEVSNLQTNEFIFVNYKKKTRKHKVNNINSHHFHDTSDTTDVNKSLILRRINEAREDILSSDLLSSVLASLREGLSYLESVDVKEIICLGLGHISERIISRYQLALLICLKTEYKVNVCVQDPVFTAIEQQILQELGLTVLEENREGKYQARIDGITIFFLPHCPKQLTNNLLWSNWNLNLRNCVIIANSFTNLIETVPKRLLSEHGSYILNIYDYVIELAIINTFKYYDIFNDTAIHIFPLKKLSLIPTDFWENCIEPKYNSDSIEFITNNFNNLTTN